MSYVASTCCAEADEWEVAPSFKELLANTNIRFCQDTVRSIQPSDAVNGTPALATASRDVGGSVYLSSGMQVDYDWYGSLLLIYFTFAQWIAKHYCALDVISYLNIFLNYCYRSTCNAGFTH